MDVRRVQLTGKSTFIVSLPKRWARRTNIKSGDPITIIELNDGSLRLTTPKAGNNKSISEAVIKVEDGMQPDTMMRMVISKYLAGYDMIRVSSKGGQLFNDEFRESLDRTEDMLMGLNALRHTPDEMVLQCVLDPKRFPVPKLISEMSKTAVGMLEDAAKALLQGQNSVAKSVIEQDYEVDKLRLLATKQLNEISAKGEIPSDELVLVAPLVQMVVADTIERVADEATRIANCSTELGSAQSGSKTMADLSAISTQAVEMHSNAVKAFLNADMELAEKTIQRLEDVRTVRNKTMKDLLNDSLTPQQMICLSGAADSFFKVADLSVDIAEKALNVTATQD